MTTTGDRPVLGADDCVRIFDTTLRDGEQAPGFSMTVGQKLRLARALAELQVDIIEAGFAAASPGDAEAVRRIAEEIEGPTICSLARTRPGDIAAAGEALAPAKSKRVHTFIATSPIHREHKLRMSTDQVLKEIEQGVRHARQWTDDVEFSAEDAIRTERPFLIEALACAIESGATTVNVPDTVGYATPEEIYDLFTFLIRETPGADGVIFSAHCHDDLGLAVANSLAAVRAGARQIEGAINGIGERAGNCAVEEAVMALRTRADHFGLDTGVEARRLAPTSKLLGVLTGNVPPRNKAIVGKNAFAHEAGIHQHGMLAHAETYEIMRPEDVGVARSSLVLGKHSGKHALAERARELGFDLGDNQLQSIFVAFKSLADKKSEVLDSDLEALILNQTSGTIGPWSLEGLHVSSGFGAQALPYAAVELAHAYGERRREAATGDGPLDAVFNAIQRITGVMLQLESFELRSVTGGEDAQGQADVRALVNGRSWHGTGVSTDVVAAGAYAFLDVINRVERHASRMAARAENQAASETREQETATV